MRAKNLFFLVACLILSLNVRAQDDYLRVTDLSQIQNGSSVIFAARYDSLSVTSYYAMKNDAAGKPQGVMFTTTSSDDGMILPMEITDNESDYCWTIGCTDGNYNFINSNGDMLGYGSSGTDFVKNGVNSTWSIESAVSGDGTSVPNHNAFLITNVGVVNRSIAFRQYSNDAIYEKFAPYANTATNLGGDVYYFYIDIFVKNAEVTPMVSLPEFSPLGGDYITAQTVTISCDTEDAIIYYTLDGKNPTDTSMVYVDPIEVDVTTTIKAFAKKDGMQSSGIVTAKYNIMEPVTVSFYENGLLLETRTLAKGQAIGDLPLSEAPEGFVFSGWIDNEIIGSSHSISEVMTSTSVVDEDLNLYAVYSVSCDNCYEAEVSSFKQSDVVVVAVSKDDKFYAMSQVKGANGQPTASEIVVSDGNVIGVVADDIKWNLTYDKGEMKIYPNDQEEEWLYCTSGSNNNSVRIGDNEDNNIFEMKSIEIDDVLYSDYLYNVSTSRFVGIYYDDDIALDWRAYKLTASGAFPTNIKGQTYHFFKCESESLYCTNIDIPQSQVIDVNTTWGNVSVVNEIVVEKGATLTIDGIITCTNAENLIIKDGGQLIHNNYGVRATLEKEIKGYGTTNGSWYTISSPLVGNVALSDIEGLMTNDYDMYRYDEPTSLWQNAKESSNNFNYMENGRGYLYANRDDATLSFVGELNRDDVSYYLTKTDDKVLSGFHLLGNPFAHDIYKGKGAAIDDDNLVDGYYVLCDSGTWGAKLFDDNPITPCQSILVKTVEEGEVVITKTNEQPYNNVKDDAISIIVRNDNYEDAVHALFKDGAGLEKINHKNVEAPLIYIPINDVNYAIAMVDANIKEIPVSFKANSMGEYTISISVDKENYDYVYLVDNYTGNVTNMLVDDYSFVATADDNVGRFSLKLYDVNSLEETQCDDVFTYVINNKLIITNMSDKATVQIFDVVGRSIVKIDNYISDVLELSLEDFCSGVYIIRKIDNNGVISQKIIVD